jgi:hypothetical protein
MLNLPFVIQNVDNQLFLKAIFALAVYAFLRIGEITLGYLICVQHLLPKYKMR